MNTLKQTLRHIGKILEHKAYVVRAGIFLRVPFLQLLTHDLSKFSPSEFWAYRKKFFPADGEDRFASLFEEAWLHHIHHNPHHWQHWLIGSMSGGEPVPMPEHFVREMVADWLAAGRAYNGSWDTLGEWVEANYPRMNLHPSTDLLLRRALVEVGVCMVD